MPSQLQSLETVPWEIQGWVHHFYGHLIKFIWTADETSLHHHVIVDAQLREIIYKRHICSYQMYQISHFISTILFHISQEIFWVMYLNLPSAMGRAVSSSSLLPSFLSQNCIAWDPLARINGHEDGYSNASTEIYFKFTLWNLFFYPFQLQTILEGLMLGTVSV